MLKIFNPLIREGREQKQMNKTNDVDQIKQLLASCSPEQRYEIFQLLRQEFPIHPIEKTLNISAEIILDAISRAK